MMTMAGLHVYESLFATEEGVEDRVIHTPLSFWQRVFNPDPTTNLWTMTKVEIIQVTCRKPAMYRIMDKLIVHPALMSQLVNAIDAQSRESRVFKW